MTRPHLGAVCAPGPPAHKQSYAHPTTRFRSGDLAGGEKAGQVRIQSPNRRLIAHCRRSKRSAQVLPHSGVSGRLEPSTAGGIKSGRLRLVMRASARWAERRSIRALGRPGSFRGDVFPGGVFRSNCGGFRPGGVRLESTRGCASWPGPYSAAGQAGKHLGRGCTQPPAKRSNTDCGILTERSSARWE